MNQEIFSKVKDFRTKLNLPVFSKAHLLDPVDISFYARFLMEELSELMKAHEKNNLVDAADAPEPDAPEADESTRRRVLVHASGFRQSPYADVAPAGPTTKLWHSSPGSSGR